MTQEAKSAAPLSAQSLFEVIEHSDWLFPSRPGRPDLFSWRTALALALRNVPLAPLVVELWPVLEQMADQVTERLNAAVADGSLLQVGFADWLALWREQFSHWHDPVRALVCQYCPNSDVARLTGHFAQFNGFSFADFVLAAVIAFEQREQLAVLLNGQNPPRRVMPYAIYKALYSDAPTMSWACTCLYARFQHHAPFYARSAPPSPITWADVAAIYPEQQPATPQPACTREDHP